MLHLNPCLDIISHTDLSYFSRIFDGIHLLILDQSQFKRDEIYKQNLRLYDCPPALKSKFILYR